MLKIVFHPDCDQPALAEATKTYQQIWRANGQNITEIMRRTSGLTFVEKKINAIVFEGVSHSYPLSLRASYEPDEKLATLVHELCHRLAFANRVRVPENSENSSLATHKQINLILYDVWATLEDENFAKRQVEVESARMNIYKEAWDWALGFSKEERQQRFESLKIN